MAITDLADASYFFALGAKVQARKPGRPGPFDLVDPRAQRGRRDASNRSVYFSLVDQITKKVRFLVGDMSVPVGWTTIEYYMGENTVHHAPTHLGPASS